MNLKTIPYQEEKVGFFFLLFLLRQRYFQHAPNTIFFTFKMKVTFKM